MTMSISHTENHKRFLRQLLINDELLAFFVLGLEELK